MRTLLYRNPRLLIVSLLLIVVAGFSAYTVLPRMEDPHYANRYAVIVTRLPGASAEHVEALVTRKIEQELLTIAEIREITSTSRAGVSVLRIELAGEVGFGEVNDDRSFVEQAATDAPCERRLDDAVGEVDVHDVEPGVELVDGGLLSGDLFGSRSLLELVETLTSRLEFRGGSPFVVEHRHVLVVAGGAALPGGGDAREPDLRSFVAGHEDGDGRPGLRDVLSPRSGRHFREHGGGRLALRDDLSTLGLEPSNIQRRQVLADRDLFTFTDHDRVEPTGPLEAERAAATGLDQTGVLAGKLVAVRGCEHDGHDRQGPGMGLGGSRPGVGAAPAGRDHGQKRNQHPDLSLSGHTTTPFCGQPPA